MKKIHALYVLVATQGISLIGSRMSSIAVGIWLYQTQGSAAYLLMIPFFNEIAAVLFGGIAGFVVDRWKRKHAMIFGDLGQAVGTAVLLLSVLASQLNVNWIYVAVAIQGVFSLFESIAADAATTMMAPDGHRDRVNAIKEMVFPLAGIVAPVLSGLLYMALGIIGVLLIDFATFLISVITLLILDIPDPKATGEQPLKGIKAFGGETVYGFRYLLRCRELLGLTVYTTLVYFMLNGPLELVIPYITGRTGNTATVSIMLGVMNLGAFTGATLLAFWKKAYSRIPVLFTGLGFSGLMFIAFGAARTPLLLGVSLFFLMMPLPVTGALFKSIVQRKTPPNAQGRIFLAISQFTNTIVPMSFVITGFLVDRTLEPAVHNPAWAVLQPFFGDRAGAGMGLLLACTGVLILVLTIAAAAIPGIHNVESRLPDYQIEDADGA